MVAAIETVVDFFKTKQWSFELDEAKHRVRSGIEGDNGEWIFYVSASDETNLCFVLSVFPQKCPQEKRQLCAELLTRINYGLLLGCFEMNFDTGRICFKASYPFPAGQISPDLVEETVEFSIAFMDRYFPAIMSVLYAGMSPVEAFAAVNKDGQKAAVPNSWTETGLPRRFLNN
jgi:hypothetical protein